MRIPTLLAAALLALAACDAPQEPARQTTVQIERINALKFQVVDSDSELMRRLYTHVGADHAELPIDPAAIGAGITAVRQEHWAVEEPPYRSGHDYFLEATNRGSHSGRELLAAYFGSLADRDDSFRIPRDRELGFEETEPGRWRSYYLHRAVAIDAFTIESATVEEHDGRPIILIDLTPAGTRSFGELTSRIVGDKLATISDGEIVIAPIIAGPIMGGQITVSMGADTEHAHDAATELVDKLRL